MTVSFARLSPLERARDNTTWVRDIRTNEKISAWDGRYDAESEVAKYFNVDPNDVATDVIGDGPAECIEIITVEGELRAWIDEPPHGFTSDEVYEAIYPMQEAAQ